jgi:PKD repeat protein
VLAAVLTLVPQPSVDADATATVADWQMNEPAGATVLTDSSGNAVHGVVGSAIQTGYVDGAVTAYHWSNTQPNQPPPKPERLVQVADDRLNPGDEDYAVTVRFRTTRTFGNIIQKGQATNPGGYFKWQIPQGKLVCKFKGVDENGVFISKTVNSGEHLLNDGLWHTVRCERKGNQVIMTIDGTIERKGNGPTGSISNDVPLTIGGKLNCDQIDVTCDYFVGEIDYVTIEAAAGPDPNESPVAVATGNCLFLECVFDSFGSYDPDGSVVRRHWFFDDGSDAVADAVAHAFAEPGDYEVRLTVTDDGGLTDTASVLVSVVSQPPNAIIDASCVFLDCTFDATRSSDHDGDVVGYAWDFGDGTLGVGSTATHTYIVGGLQTVSLTVTDNHGETDTTTMDLTPMPAPEVHIHNLTPRPFDLGGAKWVARVWVKIRDAAAGPVEGVTITARFGNARERTCTTTALGKCKVRVFVNDPRAQIPVEIIDVDWLGGYDPTSNRETDGDGNPERTMVLRPF